MELKYHTLLRENERLGRQLRQSYRIGILSNVTVHQAKEILEYSLRSEGLGATVDIGEYGNILQDCDRFSEHDCIALFWEVANLVENLPFKLHEFDKERLSALIDETKRQLDYVFGKLESAKLVLINKLSAAPFTIHNQRKNELDLICDELNDHIGQYAPSHFRLVEIDRMYFGLSAASCVDLRYFLSAKALYTVAFYRSYAEHVKPIILAAVGKTKKALIFDCDNTLWKGILGEDGPDGIKMFTEIQSLAVGLAKKGVIIGVCSKNNPEDVDDVLRNHADMVLKDDFIIIRAVNWDDKPANLRRMAQTLNIELDSFVFVDDSEFEIGLIREKLPEVTVVQVPKEYPEYLQMLQAIISRYFYRLTDTKEDLEKIPQYKAELTRIESRSKFDNIEDYLRSLDLSLQIYANPVELIPRLSQLTLKTNQFNLTTRRYSESEMRKFVEDPRHVVFAMEVSDKFGGYGVAGLVICKVDSNSAIIDTMLLSCRVLGRNIEYRFFEEVVRQLQALGVKRLVGEYVRTAKNHQVQDLFGMLGFALMSDSGNQRRFERNLEDYQFGDLDYIKVAYA